MASNIDLEAQGAANTSNMPEPSASDVGENDAADQPRLMIIDFFVDEVKELVEEYPKARLHSEERYGVLAFLNYKDALDELHMVYNNYLDGGSEKTNIGLSVERYSKTRELYNAHLKERPSTSTSSATSSGPHEEYEKSLLEMAAGVLTCQRMSKAGLLGAAALLGLRGADKGLESVVALQADTYEWFEENHGGPPRDTRKFMVDGNEARAFNKRKQRDIEKTRERLASFRAYSRRAVFALTGGFAMIVPMLVMKLYPTTLCVCLTTTLCVYFAAFLLANAMTDETAVLSTTAGYAAVLVVFVGVSTTQSGLSNKTISIAMWSVVGGLALLTLLLLRSLIVQQLVGFIIRPLD